MNLYSLQDLREKKYMGLGFGVYCERCGDKLSYDMRGYTLKDEGEKYDLCDKCAKIVAFDKRLEKEKD